MGNITFNVCNKFEKNSCWNNSPSISDKNCFGNTNFNRRFPCLYFVCLMVQIFICKRLQSFDIILWLFQAIKLIKVWYRWQENKVRTYNFYNWYNSFVSTHLTSKLASYKCYSIDLDCKSIEWFLFDGKFVA